MSRKLKNHLIFVFSAAGTPAAVPKLSNAQISEHYSTCIKLSTENVSIYEHSVHAYIVSGSQRNQSVLHTVCILKCYNNYTGDVMFFSLSFIFSVCLRCISITFEIESGKC